MVRGHVLFFVGWHQPNDGISGCGHFDRCMIAVNRLIRRHSDFKINDWILDSSAFTRIVDPKLLGKQGSPKGHLSVVKYAKLGIRWKRCGNLLAMVSQDYMCGKLALLSTGLSVAEHQRLTIFRYDRLNQELAKLAKPQDRPYVMPVLQGATPGDYVSHLNQYGDRLQPEQWVGVGSICNSNGNPDQVVRILRAIAWERPDLKLHGFGIKKTALTNFSVQLLLYSADSQAHGLALGSVREKYVRSNCPIVAANYWREIETLQQE